MKLITLSALAAASNDLIQFAHYDDDDSGRPADTGSMLGTAAKLGAVGGVGLGGYYGTHALVKKYPEQAAAVGEAVKGAVNRAGVAANKVGAAGAAGLKNYQTMRKIGADRLASVKGGLKTAAFKLKNFKLSRQPENLVELNACLEDLIQF